ncbi:hypothetical protein EDB84DRAFT_1554394, partial [Lactarius hengduanensis]
TARGSDHLDHPSRTLEPSKTEYYLLSLLTDDVTPTLRNLERLKPPEHPDSHSKEYTAVYSALLDSICCSFSNDQLRSFTQQYGLSLGSKLRKTSYAEAIVEKVWQWPSLRELKCARSGRTEVTALALALSPSELFILLGKNGSDLFQLSREYNVHASGSHDSVKGAEEYIDRVRKRTLEDTFDTPSKNPLRVRAKHPSNIMLAKRLAIRVNYQAEPSELLSQQTHYKDKELRTPTAAPLAYSLYPFSGALGDWLGDTRSQSLDISGLAQSRGGLFSIDGVETDLQHRLLGNITSSAFSVFPVSQVDEQGSLKSPHTGGLTYMDTHSWVAAQRTLPLELVKALPSQQRALHRLVYRRFPVFEQDSRHSATTKFIIYRRIITRFMVKYGFWEPISLPRLSMMDKHGHQYFFRVCP